MNKLQKLFFGKEFTALKEKCDRLTVENDTLNYYLRNGPVVAVEGVYVPAHLNVPATPETSASITLNRVSGIEMYADHLERFKQSLQTHKEGTPEIIAKLDNEIIRVREFARQARKSNKI